MTLEHDPLFHIYAEIFAHLLNIHHSTGMLKKNEVILVARLGEPKYVGNIQKFAPA